MNENMLTKEMFAKFGLAIYTSQCLEMGIINLRVALKMEYRQKITRKDIDQFYKNVCNTETLGMIISNLQNESTLHEEVIYALKIAKEKRDYLVH